MTDRLNDVLSNTIAALLETSAQLVRALNQRDAVLRRHHKAQDSTGIYCAEDSARWPCPTVRDLTADTSEEAQA